MSLWLKQKQKQKIQNEEERGRLIILFGTNSTRFYIFMCFLFWETLDKLKWPIKTKKTEYAPLGEMG